MHGWGHIENKGVIYLYLRYVPEKRTEWSGFPTDVAWVPLGSLGSMW